VHCDDHVGKCSVEQYDGNRYDAQRGSIIPGTPEAEFGVWHGAIADMIDGIERLDVRLSTGVLENDRCGVW
jgi:hypothetical protein